MSKDSGQTDSKESGRLQALRNLGILDTPKEAVFDHITAIASRVFSTDMACITLVDEHRFYFKSAYGCDVVELPKDTGLCDITVEQARLRVVRDTTQDRAAKTNPMVCAAPFVKFYAGAPLTTPDGHSIGTLCILNSEYIEFSDDDGLLLQELADYVMFHILERKQIADARETEAQARRDEKREGLGLLAGGVAHDLNNYLMGISGNASLLQAMVTDDETVAERLASIIEATQRATALTNQLMVYAGQRAPRKEQVDLARMLHGVVELAEKTMSDNINVQADISRKECFLEADPTQLQQVVVNLINNAAEAYEGKEGTITVRLGKCDRARSTIVVEDNGMGMDEKTRQSLFEPFFSTKLTGRGLGMAIVEQVVESHSGTIEVESKIGLGTRMTVSLPCVDADSIRTSDEDAKVERFSMESGRMLIVDDEEHIRDFLESAGNFLGLEIISVSSGLEALYKLDKEPLPDIVLIDASMPGMSGEETLSKIQADHPGITAIVMSGHDLAEVRERFKETQVAHFIQKPFSLDHLASVLARPSDKKHLH